MKTYTTVQGDMWYSISHAQLGEVKKKEKKIKKKKKKQENIYWYWR